MDKDNQNDPNDKNAGTANDTALNEAGARATPGDASNPEQPVDDKPIIDPEKIVVSGKGHRNLVLVIILFLIIAIGVGVWLYSKKSAPTATTPTGNSSTNDTQPSTSGPVNLVYATSEQDGTKSSLYWRGMGSGTSAKALDLPANTYISQYAVRGEQVAVVVEPGSTSTEKLAIWYSSDSGKTYKKIYTDQAGTGQQNGIGSQITSLVFSSDGKSLVYGYSPGADGGNTVTRLALGGDYKTTELFSEKQRGVFLQGYNSATQQAVYYLGCYNCDGNKQTDLMIHDGKAGTTKTLLTTATSAMVVMKDDGSELIAANGKPNPTDKPGLEAGPQVAPFVLQKVRLSDGNATTIATIQEVISGIGYTNEGEAYYNTGMKVVRTAATPVTLYEAQKDILNTFYADKDQVISSVGDYQSFMVNHFVIKTQANTTLLNGVTTTRVLGVTHK